MILELKLVEFYEILDELRSEDSLAMIPRWFAIFVLLVVFKIYKNNSFLKEAHEFFNFWLCFSALDRFMVLNLTLVKFFGWKLSDLRVHPVLNLKHSFLNLTFQQPLEETTRVFGFLMIVRNDSGWQLLLVPDQNDPLWFDSKSN